MTILFVILATVFVLAVVFEIVEMSIKETEECEHCFAEYRSLKKRVCIDCGCEVGINGTNW